MFNNIHVYIVITGIYKAGMGGIGRRGGKRRGEAGIEGIGWGRDVRGGKRVGTKMEPMWVDGEGRELDGEIEGVVECNSDLEIILIPTINTWVIVECCSYVRQYCHSITSPLVSLARVLALNTTVHVDTLWLYYEHISTARQGSHDSLKYSIRIITL